MPNVEFIARNGIVSRGNLVVSGSLVTTQPTTLSGSLSLAGDLNFQAGATRYISMSAAPTAGNGSNLVMQGGDANTGGQGGSLYFRVGLGAGGPGYGSIYIGNQAVSSVFPVIELSGPTTIYNSGPNTGTSLTVNAGGQLAMRFDWDNINLVTSAVSANRILRFTGASQYQVRGSGTTSSTTAFRVQNANASSSLSVRDDGEVTVGASIGLPGSAYVYWGDANSSIQHTGAAMNFRVYQDNQPWSFITANNSSVQAKIDTGYVRVKTGFSAVGNSPVTMSGWDGGGGTVGNVLLVKGGNSGVGTSYAGGNGSDLILENGLATDNSLGFGGTPGSIIFKYGVYNNTASVEYGRLNSSGSFLIGTTAGSAKLLISGSSNSTLFEIDSPTQNNILHVSGSGRVGIGKATSYALEIANTSSLLESAYSSIPFGYATGSAAVSITPNIYATTGNRSFYSLYIGNPTITISGSFGSYDYKGLYVAGGSTLNGGILAGDSRFFATSNAVSFQGYNPYDGQTGIAAGGITFTSRQVAGSDEAGIGAYYGGGSRLYIYNKYNASDSKIIFALAGTTIRAAFFGTGNLSIGNGETDMSARLGVKGSGATSSTTALLVQNANATASLSVKDDGTTAVLSSNENPFTVSHTNGSSKLGIVVGNGSALSAGFAALRLNDSVNVFTFGGNRTVTGYPLTVGSPAETFFIRGGGGGTSVANPSVALTDNTYNAGGYTVTSGTQTTVQIGGIGTLSNAIWKPASGSANYTLLAVAPNMSGSGTYNGIIRGIFYAPTVDSTTYGAHRAIETTAGDVVFNGGRVTISGSAGSGSALYAYKSGSTVLDIQGSQGQLFSVIDALSGSLMSVNDISGLPIVEVFSDDRVVMGTYGAPGLTVSGSTAAVATGSSAPTGTAPEGTFRFAIAGGLYYIYAYIGGAWRSGSLA